MSIERDFLYDAGRLPCECAECGWDNEGRLEIVDRYSTDYPPIPRVDIIEVYRDSGGDPDDRIIECENCGNYLDRDTVNERQVTA